MPDSYLRIVAAHDRVRPILGGRTQTEAVGDSNAQRVGDLALDVGDRRLVLERDERERVHVRRQPAAVEAVQAASERQQAAGTSRKTRLKTPDRRIEWGCGLLSFNIEDERPSPGELVPDALTRDALHPLDDTVAGNSFHSA